MAISLQKGGRVDLSKESTASVFRIGLGWDAAQPGKEFDLDAMALMLKADGKVLSDNNMVFYGNLEDPSKSVKHSGDNRTGAGDGDDETITIDTTKVPAEVQEVVILVNIHDAKNRQQNFGMVHNAKVNLYEGATSLLSMTWKKMLLWIEHWYSADCIVRMVAGSSRL